jgi:hypothetical protein
MHTAYELNGDMFSVSIDGVAAHRDELLTWGPLDCLGVVIDRPVGALGAGLLILLAITALYDVADRKRRTRLIYPDIFLFHVGGPWGAFSGFDFWPDHKEIFLGLDRREILRGHKLAPQKLIVNCQGDRTERNANAAPRPNTER